jgi:hypothetical protein
MLRPMTALHLSRQVACVVGQAPAYLDRFFAEHAKDGAAVLALRAPFAVPGLPEMTLTRDSVVRVARADHRGEMIARFDVSWQPSGGGPYPAFAGSLSIANAEDYQSCVLQLDGTYEPPLGALGATFDAVIGRAVAESTGRDLLERVGSYLEGSYGAAEAAKPTRRSNVS